MKIRRKKEVNTEAKEMRRKRKNGDTARKNESETDQETRKPRYEWGARKERIGEQGGEEDKRGKIKGRRGAEEGVIEDKGMVDGRKRVRSKRRR